MRRIRSIGGGRLRSTSTWGLACLLAGVAACGGGEEDAQTPGPDVEPASVGAMDPHAHADEGRLPDAAAFGEVHFPTSCAPEAGVAFERGVALLHSFYFQPAQEAFEIVLERDPTCAMGAWGLAMASRGNPFAGPPGEAGTREGLAAAERALSLDPPTPRERGYVEAVLALFREHESVDFRTRALRYEEAMDALRRASPEDHEATIFYAREVTANASPADAGFERQLRAAALMEPLFEAFPRHPGLAHYIIHAYDAPPLAERGLPAARAYAEIAPEAPHALHMPSHIFTRMGYWEESIETNRRSAEAAGPESGDRLHAWDYMVYGHIQRGEWSEADSVLAEANALIERAGIEGRIPYNAAAMEARIPLERAQWEAAAGLPIRSAADAPPEAVTRFARGVGMARAGDPDGARAEVEALTRIRDRLRAGGEEDWAERTEAQRLAVSAWILHAEGRTEEALASADRAGAIEERVEKHPVTPGPLLPARELQGDLLMELGRYEEALEAYRATLEREPNRGRTLRALTEAETRAGRTAGR